MAPTTSGKDGLRVTALRKVYKGGHRKPPIVANDSLDLSVQSGTVFGLLGPNGAGKSTLVKQIIGLVAPTSGSIHLDGVDLVAKPDWARRQCSYLPQGALPIDSLRVTEAIELAARVRGASRAQARERCEHMVEALELEEWRRAFGSALSGGVKRLMGFAMAAVWPTSLVILDEPTNDVDPVRRRHLWREIRNLRDAGTTVLLVTHNVLEAEHSVDRLAIIDRGRILAEGTPASLRHGDQHELRLSLRLHPESSQGDRNALPDFADRNLPEFFPREPAPFLTGRWLRLSLDEERARDALDWARSLREQGQVEEYALAPVNLEDTYVRLVGSQEATT
jgi:ABC-2 type transport system ATP-binding protein